MFFFVKINLSKDKFCGGSMLQDLREYKLVLDAIKFSISNNNVESDMKEEYDENIKYKLLHDEDVKKMLLRREQYDRRRYME